MGDAPQKLLELAGRSSTELSRHVDCSASTDARSSILRQF